MLELTFDTHVDLAHSDVRFGVGCFETLRLQDGRPRRLDRHLARMARTCAFLGLDLPPCEAVVRAYLASSKAADVALGTLRLLAVDAHLQVHLAPFPPPLPPCASMAIASGLQRYSASPLHPHKTLSYLEHRLLHREAAQRGLFDVVALNERGQLTDGGRTNLFLLLEGQIWTPPVSDGVFPGIARACLLEAGLVGERSLTPADLDAADGVFLANALRGLIPVRLPSRGSFEVCRALLEGPSPPAAGSTS